MQWKTRSAWIFNHPGHVLMRLTTPATSRYIKIRTPIEYNFAIYMQFFKCTVEVFIFSFQVILSFVMGEAALFSIKLLLDCNTFLIHVPFPSVRIFLPNFQEFNKANCDTSGFSFFPLEAFAWLPHSITLQRQTKTLSSLFVMRKINGKLITGPHSAFKYKQCCISVCKYKKL